LSPRLQRHLPQSGTTRTGKGTDHRTGSGATGIGTVTVSGSAIVTGVRSTVPGIDCHKWRIGAAPVDSVIKSKDATQIY